MAEFNPYHRWLQIPPSEQPANPYRLLGLAVFESDLEVIDNAAEQRMAHLRSVQNGPRGEIAQKLMNEISRARIDLLDAKKKSEIDANLRLEMESLMPQAAETAVPVLPQRSLPPHPKEELPAPQLPTPQLPAPQLSTQSRLQEFRKQRTNPLLVWGSVLALFIFVSVLVGAIVIFARPSSSVVSKSGQRKNETDGNLANKANASSPNNSEAKNQKDEPTTQNEFSKFGSKKQSTPAKTVAKKRKSDSRSRDKTPSRKATFKKHRVIPEQQLVKGAMVRLISLLDLENDLKLGMATVRDDTLELTSATMTNQVVFPIMPSVYYDLEFRVTRLELSDSLNVGFHVLGTPAVMVIDRSSDQGPLTGLGLVNSIKLDDPQRSDVTKQPLLNKGQETRVRLAVRPNRVELFIDRVRVYRWVGEANQLSQPRNLESIPGQLYNIWIGSERTKFQLNSMTLTPRGPSARDPKWFANSTHGKFQEKLGEPVDLLENFEPSLILSNPVSKSDAGLKLGFATNRRSGAEFPHELPTEYDLKLTVETTGKQGIVLLPIIGGRRAAIMIDSDSKNPRTGIQRVDGKYLKTPGHVGSQFERLLQLNQDVPLTCKVRADSIRIFADDRLAYVWSGRPGRLNSPNWRSYPKKLSQRRLQIANLIGTSNIIKSLEVIPVESTGRINKAIQFKKLQNANPLIKLDTSFLETEAFTTN